MFYVHHFVRASFRNQLSPVRQFYLVPALRKVPISVPRPALHLAPNVSLSSQRVLVVPALFVCPRSPPAGRPHVLSSTMRPSESPLKPRGFPADSPNCVFPSSCRNCDAPQFFSAGSETSPLPRASAPKASISNRRMRRFEPVETFRPKIARNSSLTRRARPQCGACAQLAVYVSELRNPY